MRSLILPLIAAFFQTIAISQNWSEPVNITNNGHSGYPDFTVTSDGTIHVVYLNWIIDEKHPRWIEYKNSTDGGLTWSEPDTVAYGSYEIWLPSITSSSDNKVFIAHSYAYKIVAYKVVNGQILTPDTVSLDMPECGLTKLHADCNDNIYCFWHSGATFFQTYYRKYENETWGEIDYPYFGDTLPIYHVDIRSVAIDHEETIHLAGHVGFENFSDLNLFYITKSQNDWSNLEFFYKHIRNLGVSIQLDANNNPCFTYSIESCDYHETDSIFYRYRNNGNWIEELVDIQTKSGTKVFRLIIDGNNSPNIIYSQYQLDGVHDLLLGYKSNGIWHKDTIDSKPTYYNPCFRKVEDEIYGIYQCEAYNLQFVKTVFVQAIEERENNTTLNLTCYPNPFCNDLKISYKLNNKQSGLKLTVYNTQGAKVQVVKNPRPKDVALSLPLEGVSLLLPS